MAEFSADLGDLPSLSLLSRSLNVQLSLARQSQTPRIVGHAFAPMLAQETLRPRIQSREPVRFREQAWISEGLVIHFGPC